MHRTPVAFVLPFAAHPIVSATCKAGLMFVCLCYQQVVHSSRDRLVEPAEQCYGGSCRWLAACMHACSYAVMFLADAIHFTCCMAFQLWRRLQRAHSLMAATQRTFFLQLLGRCAGAGSVKLYLRVFKHAKVLGWLQGSVCTHVVLHRQIGRAHV